MLIILTNKNNFALSGVGESADTASVAEAGFPYFGVNYLTTKDLRC